jgi:hypothetical protein
MFDNIKREVIKPAKAPDRQGEQASGLESPMLHNQNGRSHDTEDQEENSFEFNPGCTGEIFHRKRVMVIAKRGVDG